MANYVSRAVNPRIPDYMVVKARVPSPIVLTPGSLVALIQLDSALANNWQVFIATQPATANLNVQMAVVINDGFETLADGRRPDGQPDYTQYMFNPGDVVTCILMAPGIEFELSVDCITNGTALVAGDFIEPVNANYHASRVAAATGRTAGVMSGMRVLFAGKNFRLGGQMGGQFCKTVVAICEPPVGA